MSKTIRTDQELLNMLDLIKGELTGSYNVILKELAHNRLIKSHAYTDNGYIPARAVVKMTTGKILVIKSVDEFTVYLSDGSYVINGSKECKEMEMLAVSVGSYEGILCK